MLEFNLSVPDDAVDGTPVAVLLHGRGSHRGDLQALRGRLPEGLALITPQAPHPGHPWGYGPGWAWYRHIEEDRVDPQSLDRSLLALDAFLEELPGRLPVSPGPTVLGGFSQGGTVSLAYALRNPGRVQGVLNFSGFLVHGDTLDVEPEAAGATPVFWGHGERDPNIPWELAEKGRDRLRRAGADLDARDYPIGHWIAPEELNDARGWVEDRLD